MKTVWNAIKWTWLDFWPVIVLGVMCVLVVLYASGCQKATKEISENAMAVGQLARDSQDHAERARSTIAEIRKQMIAVGPPAPDEPTIDQRFEDTDQHLLAVISGQQQIEKHSAKIQGRIPDIADRESLWIGVLKTWGWVAAVGMAIVAAVYFGFGGVIRKAFMALGWFIPAPKKDEASLDRKVLNNQASYRESIAHKRATDPKYNAAWKATRQ